MTEEVIGGKSPLEGPPETWSLQDQLFWEVITYDEYRSLSTKRGIGAASTALDQRAQELKNKK